MTLLALQATAKFFFETLDGRAIGMLVSHHQCDTAPGGMAEGERDQFRLVGAVAQC